MCLLAMGKKKQKHEYNRYWYEDTMYILTSPCPVELLLSSYSHEGGFVYSPLYLHKVLLRIHDTFTSKNNKERDIRSLLALYFDT